MKKSRKPSVLVSRQFDSGNLVLTLTDSSNEPKSSNNARERSRRIIENGVDVTPLPLVRRDHPSIEDVDFDNEDKYESDSSDLDDITMPWIPELMDGIVDKALSERPAFYNRARDSIPLHEVDEKSDDGKEDCTQHYSDSKSAEEISSRTLPAKCTSDQTSCKHALDETNKNNSHKKSIRLTDQEIQTNAFHASTISSNTVRTNKIDVGSSWDRVENNPGEESTCNVKKKIEDVVQAVMTANDSLLDTSEGYSIPKTRLEDACLEDRHGNINFQSIMLAKKRQEALQSESVMRGLLRLERGVQQNIYHSQQTKYRGSRPFATLTNQHNEPVQKKVAISPHSLELILNFSCTLSSKRVVTCMSWSKAVRDILAVGYSGNERNFEKPGVVMLWSLRNPSFPEKIIETKVATTATAFSTMTPTVLAIGMEDGCISLYDTSIRNYEKAHINTLFIPGRHMSTVTQLVWIFEKQSKVERLISISVDGRVLQWSIRKGMCLHPLVTLKRQNLLDHETKLPNIPMALCIGFQEDSDCLTYVTGCEDGSLFMCSRSYTEKHLTEVKGQHMGPVTDIAFSPFDESIFISCCADSSVKFWRCSSRQNELIHVFSIEPANLWAPINSIAWSPSQATVFGLVGGDGRIEVYDIAKSLLDPVVNISPSSSARRTSMKRNSERTKITFSDNGRILVSGDERGRVEVFLLNKLEATMPNRTDEKKKLLEVLSTCGNQNTI